MALSSFSRLSAFSLSLDLCSSTTTVDSVDQFAVQQAVGQLLRLTGQLSVPATWSTPETKHVGVVSKIRQASRNHEIAIWGDADWTAAATPRHEFARELSRRVLAARAFGFETTTLVFNSPALPRHGNLLERLGISATRCARLVPTSRRAVGARSMREGLWEVPAASVFPSAGRWFSAATSSVNIRRAIDRTSATRDVYHLVVDVPRLAAGGNAAMRALQRIVLHAVQRRDERRLQILTAARITEQLGQSRAARPARSILRIAA
ncbi:MAG: hypothetical protein KDA42_03910 [Planctomycetales bacterium]|nr:hypothetical protein [Planctomycetales bacterium]